jgi:arabinose-5-phosphate isomerase
MVSPDTAIKQVILNFRNARRYKQHIENDNRNYNRFGEIRRMLNERDSFAELTAKDTATKIQKLIQSKRYGCRCLKYSSKISPSPN